MQRGFLEFFAGIGLVHLGLKPSGWQCVYANDIDPKKQRMYLDEMPEASAYYHLENIWNADAVLEKIDRPALLATASFPCIDLSLAGGKRGLNGKHSSAFFGFIEVLKRLKIEGRMPACILLENVAGLLTGHKGKDFAAVCAAAADLGFCLDAFFVDAKHFTPQSRPRLFIIGILQSVLPAGISMEKRARRRCGINARCDLCPPRLADAMQKIELPTGWIAFDLPPLPPVQRELASAIDLDDEQEWWDSAAVRSHAERFSDLHKTQIEKIVAEHREGVWIGTIFRRMRRGKMMAEVRFDGLAGCLRTPRGGSGKQIVIVVDRGRIKMRWMTPIEYARLQGASNYKIAVSRNQALTGFADAVCVPAIEWIAENVLEPIAKQARM